MCGITSIDEAKKVLQFFCHDKAVNVWLNRKDRNKNLKTKVWLNKNKFDLKSTDYKNYNNNNNNNNNNIRISNQVMNSNEYSSEYINEDDESKFDDTETLVDFKVKKFVRTYDDVLKNNHPNTFGGNNNYNNIQKHEQFFFIFCHILNN